MKPIEITIDFQANAGYIYYQNDRRVVSGRDVWKNGAIHADFDEEGNVIGIELLGFDDELLAHARAFARERGLEFPRDLAGVLPSTD